MLTNKINLQNCCRKWEEKLNTSIKWKQVFQKIHKIQEVKLKWLQIRILHRILATNIILKEMGIVNNALCNWCATERDSISHFLWKCNMVKAFWIDLAALLNEKCLHASNLRFTQNLVIFGVEDNIKTDNILDYIILQAKSFLYFCKVNSRVPRLVDFIQYLHDRYKIEQYNAKIMSSLHNFNMDWVLYTPLF